MKKKYGVLRTYGASSHSEIVHSIGNWALQKDKGRYNQNDPFKLYYFRLAYLMVSLYFNYFYNPKYVKLEKIN